MIIRSCDVEFYNIVNELISDASPFHSLRPGCAYLCSIRPPHDHDVLLPTLHSVEAGACLSFPCLFTASPPKQFSSQSLILSLAVLTHPSSSRPAPRHFCNLDRLVSTASDGCRFSMLCREDSPYDNDWRGEWDEGYGEETKGAGGKHIYMRGRR